MNTKLSLILLIAAGLTLTACGSGKEEGSDSPTSYAKCLETEAAKLLDETGSNLDYANEMAVKACS